MRLNFFSSVLRKYIRKKIQILRNALPTYETVVSVSKNKLTVFAGADDEQ
jgi:hypothetical protein